MMQVWMRKARKKATCTYDGCPDKLVSNGDYYVVCQWVMNTRGGKRWYKQKYFHPQCWINQAIAELEQRPVTETRGGHRMAITDSNRLQRVRLLRQRASVVQRIKAATIDQRYDKVVKLTESLEQLATEIEQYGGRPKKW